MDGCVSAVCEACWDSIRRASCSDPLFLQTREKLRSEGAVDDLISMYVFEKGGAFQHIAHAIKYQAYEKLAEELGRRLGDAFGTLGCPGDLIVPVPLHRIKFRERGYNQADLIARGLARTTGIPVRPNAVRRSRHTKTQTKLTIDERRRNMAGAFEPGTEMLAGAVCLLVDDVITTGATTAACAAALRRAGAGRVIAVSAALAKRDADLA